MLGSLIAGKPATPKHPAWRLVSCQDAGPSNGAVSASIGTPNGVYGTGFTLIGTASARLRQGLRPANFPGICRYLLAYARDCHRKQVNTGGLPFRLFTLPVKEEISARVNSMAHRALILSAAYLAADLACALSVNGAVLFGSGRMWSYLGALQLF